MLSAARWCLNHPVSVNLLMVFLLFLGGVTAFHIQREMFPQFKTDQVLITVLMEGGSTPEQVDHNIVQLIEPRLEKIDGIKKIESKALETHAEILVDVYSSYDVQKIKNDIQDEIDQIRIFPEKAEKPTVLAIEFFHIAIQLAIYGDASPGQLREVAEWVRDDLRTKKLVSQSNIYAPQNLEISLHIPPQILQAKNLSYEALAQQIRAHSLEFQAGEVKTGTQSILLKGDARKTSKAQLRKIPIHFPNGEVLTLGELAHWEDFKDGFSEEINIVEYNQKRAAVITIKKSNTEDILDLCDGINDYAQSVELPYGLQMETFQDMSEFVRERLELIIRNGLMGLVLVLFVLTLFLDWRIALWTAIGIGFSLVGSLPFIYAMGGTINMLSLFGFLMATGIVVDDAIVISENFFQKYNENPDGVQAARKTLKEILWPVTTMVLTTIIAFIPLMFISGMLGKFIAILPLVVIATLALSLVEALFILPVHLAHHCSNHDTRFIRFCRVLLFPFIFLARPLQKYLNASLDYFSKKILPIWIAGAIRHRYSMCVAFLSVLIFLVGLLPAGIVQTSLFPKVDSDVVSARLEFPKGTDIHITEEYTREVMQALDQAGKDFTTEEGINPIQETFLQIGKDGAHQAQMICQLIPVDQGRTISGQQFSNHWRSIVPTIPQATSLTFGTEDGGPPAKPIELLVSSNNLSQLLKAEAHVQKFLGSIFGVVDITSTNKPGTPTLEIRLKPDARHLATTESDLLASIQDAYAGIKLDTFYRNNNEVDIYLRAPQRDRISLRQLKQLNLKNGLRIEQVADLKWSDEPEEIRRVNGARTVRIVADIDSSQGVAAVDVRNKFHQEFTLDILPSLYPEVAITSAGESQEGEETFNSMVSGYVPALAAIYFLLATLFGSYVQPLIIMTAIPFSLIGSIIGHYFLGLQFNLLSSFGLVALTGIAVNDSLVLIDCINQSLKTSSSLVEAFIDGAQKRLRPILLTSLTTIAGLSPILFETSFQAQFLIPMVTSIVFGVGFTTLLILVLIPVSYYVIEDLKYLFSEEYQISAEKDKTV